VRLVVVVKRDAKVRHLAVESGTRTRSLCGQVQSAQVVPSVAAIRGQWELAVDADGERTRNRAMCASCETAWDREWVPWVDAVREGVEPPARRASAG